MILNVGRIHIIPIDERDSPRFLREKIPDCLNLGKALHENRRTIRYDFAPRRFWE